MIETFLSKIGTGIFTLLISLAGLFGTVPQNFGSQLAVGGETYYLSGSGMGSTDVVINLTKFGYTNPDGTWQDFSMTNFGTLGCGTFEPGNMKGKQEFTSFTGITQNSDNTAQLTGVSRGLERFSPYAASTTLQTSHAGGTKFVVSNSPPCFYENYVTINNDETITSVKTFASTTAPKYDAGYTAAGNEFVSFSQLNATAIAGGATSTEASLGFVQLATKSQQAGSTASSTAGAPLCLLSREADATYDGTKTNQTVITGASNTIDANYIATSSNYTLSGTVNFTNMGTMAVSASTTFSAATTTTVNLMAQNQIQTGRLIATSSIASQFPYASTTAITVSGTASTTSLIVSNTATLPIYATTSASGVSGATAGNTITKIAYCLSGDVAISGGFLISTAGTAAVTDSNQSGTNWMATAQAMTNNAVTLTTTAYCLNQ